MRNIWIDRSGIILVAIFIIHIVQFPIKSYILTSSEGVAYKNPDDKLSGRAVRCTYWAGYREIATSLIALNAATGGQRKTCPLTIIFSPSAHFIG